MMKEDEKLIAALFSELSESYNKGDVERFTSAFDRENVSLIGTAVDEIQLDIDQIRTQFQRDVDQTQSRDLSFEKFDFFLHGEFAYVISKLEFKGKTAKGESFILNMRVSAMLEKTHGKWLFRHLHCSVPDKNVEEGNSI
ncbi:MAG: nuclear transport factor 2 family protein [Deltaproteobacteria bacterium]